MKLLILSDLHVEFAPFDPVSSAVAQADVVVLAGDIHTQTQGIVWARSTFPDKPIVYVAGNHEFYGGHWLRTLDDLREAARLHEVHFLENDSVTIHGTRFLGCTLWTDFELLGRERRTAAMKNVQRALNDYRAIEAEPLREVYWNANRHRLTALHTLRRHRESLAWLGQQLEQPGAGKTVVVTHHYPHRLSTAPRFAGQELNPGFGSDLSPQLLTLADLWIHGHTHDSAYYFVDWGRRQVRVVCNPRGYPQWRGVFENEQFKADYLLDV